MCKRYEIEASEITQMVYDLSLKANRILPEGVKKIISTASDREKMPLAKQAFSDILENAKLAEEKSLPICQDCGLAVVFVEIGQDLCVKGGSIEDAINEGVRRAYIDGCLRKSVVKDPLFRRENSGDNTPAVIHWKVCSGSDIRITVSPKGMGSENMSRIYMLKPADGAEGVIRSVVEAVKIAGPNPCPPIVLGIGIGGNFETVALAAKKALLKPEGVRHNIPEYAEIEREILKRVNALGIGPGGYGGMTTALDAHIETLPTHIAGMPVAVNICCHALRHAEGTIEGRILDD
ncbi:MAG: fumarate hydratase [Synergistaceae bacterium]|nr:fumarate hydratase [Synergistaceae bacterium]MBP9975731.1 fumarate hydratase [Synergistaceae bacterium]MCE5184231.1 fumarate hydratase [Synergistaceae bacterium]